MCRIADELVLALIDSQMLAITGVHQAIIAAPTLRVDDCIERNPTTNNRLQSAFFVVRHDLGIDSAIFFEDTKDDGLAARTASTLAAHAVRAEVRDSSTSIFAG